MVVTTNHLELADGARISAESRAEDGNAGNISLTARDSLTMTDSFVETRSELSAGGNIHIQVEDILLAQNSVINASANGVSPGDDGGNVTIQPSRFIILNNSDITAQANAGNGGNITIRVEFILQSAESTIDASSRFGLDGEIVIDSPNEVTGTVAVLDAPVFDVVDLLRDYCAVEVLSERSSFTMKGRGGLPVLPNDYH